MSSLLFFDIEIAKLDEFDPKDYELYRSENANFDFGAETNPKENMNGSMVDEYFRDGRIAEISSYCEADVKATVQVYKRFKSTNLI